MKNNTDIVDEVKQEMKNEKIMNIIRNYGKYILSSIIVFIIAFSIYVYLNNNKISKQKVLAEQYQSLFLETPPTISQEKEIQDYIKHTQNTIFEYLASFQYAKLLSNHNKSKEAINLLSTLSEKTLFPEMSNLAIVQASEIIIEKNLKDYRNQTIKRLSTKLEKNDTTIPHFYIMQIMLVQLMINANQLEDAKLILLKMDKTQDLPPNIQLLRNTLSNIIFTRKYE